MHRIQLLEALEFVFKGITAKELFEQSASFVFSGGRIYSYNDEVSMSYPLLDCDIEGAVKGEEFYKLISRLSKDKLEVETTENVLTIKCGRAKAGLSFSSEIKLPFDSIQYKGNWEKIPAGMLDAMKFASIACSDDMSRAVLTCIHISEKGVIEASDSLRIISHKINGKWNLGDRLIPHSSMSTLYKYAGDIIEVAASDNWIHFRTKEDAVFSARTFNGDRFPDVSQHIEIKGEKVEFPKQVIDIIERASIFATSSQKDLLVFPEVVMHFADGKMVVSSSSDIGWFEESAPIKYEGKEIEFAIHPDLFQDIVCKIKNCELGERSILFEGDNWKYVVAMQVKSCAKKKGRK